MIAVGDRVPDVTLKAVTPEGVEDVSTAELLGHGKVVLFGVPAAFSNRAQSSLRKARRKETGPS